MQPLKTHSTEKHIGQKLFSRNVFFIAMYTLVKTNSSKLFLKNVSLAIFILVFEVVSGTLEV